MRRFLSWVGLIFCLIGLLFSIAIVVGLVGFPYRGPVVIIAILVMIVSAILLLPPILGICALLRPAGLLGADEGRKASSRPLPPRAAKVASSPAGERAPAEAVAEAQPPRTPKRVRWPLVFAIAASVFLIGIKMVFPRISFVELVGLQVIVAVVYVLLLRRHAQLLRRRPPDDAAAPDARPPVSSFRRWLAFAFFVGISAVPALIIGQDREWRPVAFVDASLLIAALAICAVLSRRISRRAAEARARGGEPDVAVQRRDVQAKNAMGLVLSLGAIGGFPLLYLHARSVELRRAPFIRSEVFHTLPGCPTSGAGLSVLPRSCDDPRYEIVSAPDAFGLPIPTSKYDRWLRIGPDAALIYSCNLRTCPIKEVRTGAFVTRAVTP